MALVTGAVDFQKISEAAWLGIPLHKEAMGLFAIDGSPEFISALFTIIPIALATMMEHVGDIAAISATVGHNYICLLYTSRYGDEFEAAMGAEAVQTLLKEIDLDQLSAELTARCV